MVVYAESTENSSRTAARGFSIHPAVACQQLILGQAASNRNDEGRIWPFRRHRKLPPQTSLATDQASWQPGWVECLIKNSSSTPRDSKTVRSELAWMRRASAAARPGQELARSEPAWRRRAAAAARPGQQKLSRPESAGKRRPAAPARPGRRTVTDGTGLEEASSSSSTFGTANKKLSRSEPAWNRREPP